MNIAEKAEGFAVSGNTGTEAGVTVTVEVGTATLSTTSADDSGTATWSVDVPADASYITGTSVDVRVTAAKTGLHIAERGGAHADGGPRRRRMAPSYTAPGSLKVGVAIPAMSPTGSIGVNEYDAPGLPTGLSINAGTGVISGTPDGGGHRHRHRDGDGLGHRGQHRHGVDHVPGGGEGRSDAERVRSTAHRR